MSVLIRCKNEDAYLDTVLSAVRLQEYVEGVEIVVVDNLSTDRSREIAEAKADTVGDCFDYRHGLALNLAAAVSSGDNLVVLSTDAIPAYRNWLASLSAYAKRPR